MHFSVFQNKMTFLPSVLHIRMCVCGHQFSLCCDHYLWCELCTLHWRKPCWRVYDSWESKLGVAPHIENCFFIRKLWHYISGKHAYRCLFVILHQQPFVERDLYATFSLRDLCPYVYCTEKDEKKGRSDRTDFFQICHCTRLCSQAKIMFKCVAVCCVHLGNISLSKLNVFSDSMLHKCDDRTGWTA